MADLLDKFLMDEAAGRELATQTKSYVDKNSVSPSTLASTLAEYDKSSVVDSKISSAIEESENKIFGEGKLAEAFDTIKEIGDYLENHDDVAAGLTAEIGKKLDKETYESEKSDLEDRVSANESDIADLKAALGTDDEESGESVIDRIEKLESDKLDSSEAASTYQTIEGMEQYETKEQAEAKYLQASDLKFVSVETVQGWFK